MAASMSAPARRAAMSPLNLKVYAGFKSSSSCRASPHQRRNASHSGVHVLLQRALVPEQSSANATEAISYCNEEFSEAIPAVRSFRLGQAVEPHILSEMCDPALNIALSPQHRRHERPAASTSLSPCFRPAASGPSPLRPPFSESPRPPRHRLRHWTRAPRTNPGAKRAAQWTKTVVGKRQRERRSLHMLPRTRGRRVVFSPWPPNQIDDVAGHLKCQFPLSLTSTFDHFVSNGSKYPGYFVLIPIGIKSHPQFGSTRGSTLPQSRSQVSIAISVARWAGWRPQQPRSPCETAASRCTRA